MRLALRTWQKPTNTCLLTRLPFGRRITMEGLQRIEEAERLLLDRGYDWVRVRAHGDLARIEVAPELRQRALNEAEALIAGLEGLGFRYVTLDLRGYQLYSMNAQGVRGPTAPRRQQCFSTGSRTFQAQDRPAGKVIRSPRLNSRATPPCGVTVKRPRRM